MNLIIESFKRLPLSEYQIPVKKALETVTDEQFQNSKLWKEPSIKRKDYPSTQVLERLQVMKPEAVLAVLRRLYQSLWRIKATEEQKAANNELKAAAQQRILLPNVDENAVGAIVQWIYKGTLRFTDANNLCEIYGLAGRLGIQQLADTCMSKLSGGTLAALQHANIEGIHLQELLDRPQPPITQGSLPDLVRTVFFFVLKHEKPPAALKQLVIEAIADSADAGLLAVLLQIMNCDVRGQLCIALTDRLAKVKMETKEHGAMDHNGHSSFDSMKSEVPFDEGSESKYDWKGAGQPMSDSGFSTNHNAYPDGVSASDSH